MISFLARFRLNVNFEKEGQWKGDNMLGKLLMQVREEIRQKMQRSLMEVLNTDNDDKYTL